MNRRLLGILKPTRMPMFASAFYLIADPQAGGGRCGPQLHRSPLPQQHPHLGLLGLGLAQPGLHRHRRGQRAAQGQPGHRDQAAERSGQRA